jgi:hypothetical protein
MEEGKIIVKNSGLSIILFVASIFVLAYWSIGQAIDVYDLAVVGAIYEILWLFMILGLFGLPVAALVFLIKEKFSFKSLHLYTIIISVFSILHMFSIL